MRENPLAVGAVAIAAGTAVGLVLPSTQFESEYIGETSERLVDKAQEVAREAIDKVQDAAKQMTQPENNQQRRGRTGETKNCDRITVSAYIDRLHRRGRLQF